jgi:hypothetical protein
MSCPKDEVDATLAYNKGHNDGWTGRPPVLPCRCLTCEVNQRYRMGHANGLTAKYYYEAGYKAGKADAQ